MSEININTRAARDTTNRWLPNLIALTGRSAEIAANGRHSVNPRVLDRNNLRTRLRNVELDIQALANDMRMLHNVTMQNIDLYERAELATIASVQTTPTDTR